MKKLDLRDKITVFIISIGDINYEDCKNSVNNQDSIFKTIEIKNTYPMHTAFQKMIDLCDTEFYVQVDEDMILEKDAVRTLYENINKKFDYCAFPLWDPHLKMGIEAIKIYRHKVFKKFPYIDNFSFEMEQYSRVRTNKYRILNVPDIKEFSLGTHSPKWTPLRIFCRYKKYMELHRKYGYFLWMKNFPLELKDRFIRDHNEIDFFALTGLISGLFSDLEETKHAIDDRNYAKEEYDKIVNYFTKNQ